MSWSGSSRPTAVPRPASAWATWRSPPGGRSSTGARDSRRWTSTRSWPERPRSRWSMSWHTRTSPGSRNEKRWQDVEELLGAGIDVISTVNIQHLESLNDVVERITGAKQRETIPDEVVRAADQVELVDMTPFALRRRMAHGNIYPAEKIDAALANYFREGNLGALRELALLWMADRVDEALQDYMRDHGIEGPWETRERILVGVSGRAEDEPLIRRAARMATRRGGELLAVHVDPRGRHRRYPGTGGDAEARRDGRRVVPRGGRAEHAGGAARLRPGRECHAGGAGGQQTAAFPAAAPTVRYQPGDPGLGPDRRPRDLDDRGATARAAPRDEGRRAVHAAPRVRFDVRARHTSRADVAADGLPGPGRCLERVADVPAGRRRHRGDRRALARARRGRRELSAGELLLRAPDPHVDDLRSRSTCSRSSCSSRSQRW